MCPGLLAVPFLLFNAWQHLYPDSAHHFNHEGIVKLGAFEFNKAVENFRSAVAVRPTSLALHVNLSLACFYSGDFAEAGQHLEYVLAQDSRDPYALFLSGVIADREGRAEDAFDYFQNVLEVAPGDPGTYYHLGLIALREEKCEQAVTLFRKSLEANPECTASLYNLGRALVLSGKREEGETVLRKFRLLYSQKKPGLGGGMGDPSLLVGRYGQPREIPAP